MSIRRSIYNHSIPQQLPIRKGQASITTYSSRLKTGVTALLVPQGPLISTGGTLPRAAKRNYAETDDDDLEERRTEEEGAPMKSRQAFMTNHVYQ
jgi:hypothetical protein